MRVLCVHNQFRQYAGSDIVAATDEKILADHAEVTSYTRHSGELEGASPLQRVRAGISTLYSERTTREISEIVSRFQPDIAYVHNVFPLISPSVYHVLHKSGIPAVHILHDFRLWCPNSRFYVNGQICEACKTGSYWHAVPKRCVKQNVAYSALYAASLYVNRSQGLLQNMGGYICLTEFAKNLLLQSQVPEHKIHVCPNHIDTSRFTPQYGNGQYALYVGGLYIDKGVMTIVRAFAKLPHIPLKVVGSGDAEPELRDYIAMHRLTNIELVGYKDGSEKLEYLRNSMFTIVASHCYENFPIVVLEAFASGKPVVASAIGALPYIVQDHETGLLFKPQTPDDLAEKVGWLYSHPDQMQAMGRAARAVVERNYDARLRPTSLLNIFNRVIHQSRMN
jgi:glycosyltransferase involved in cell wall biosynthesis